MNSRLFDQIRFGRTASVKKYVRDGGDLEILDGTGNTVLIHALMWQKMAIAKLLVESGASVSTKGMKNQVPLHHAARSGDASIVELLLSHGANVRVRDTGKSTPLHWAAKGCLDSPKNHVSVINQLIAAGSPIDPLDSTDRTPLWHASHYDKRHFTRPKVRLAIIESLLIHGANPKRQSRGTLRTPIDAARGDNDSKGWAKAIELLEEYS